MGINNSKEFLKELKAHPENFYIIHYSCQNLNDDNEGLSPRITSIAVSHFSTEQTVSFSTHSVAEEMHISRGNVRERFDDIERELLKSFYSFVRDRRDKYWVHWNMRNLTYGFEHLEHRYRALGGQDATIIPVERRLNLNDLIADRFGSGYAKHPKLSSLMELNGGIHRHVLTGADEVQAFQNNEFIRMHGSTLAKVGFFHSVIRKLLSGNLRTASRGYGIALDRLFESRWAKTVGLLGTLLGVGTGIWQTYLWFAGAV
ncbi:hypothetical protein ACU8V1_13960 [Rhizobium leguminosarum]